MNGGTDDLNWVENGLHAAQGLFMEMMGRESRHLVAKHVYVATGQHGDGPGQRWASTATGQQGDGPGKEGRGARESMPSYIVALVFQLL